MQLNDAADLLKNGINYNKNSRQIWADLGAGSGTFTIALSSLLPEESIVYAIDKNAEVEQIPDKEGITLIRKQDDFTRMELPDNLDGILMANSIHFLKDKSSFIKSCQKKLKQNGSFLIVEYDTDVSNPWVPYPLSFNSLKNLFKEAGFSFVKKLAEKDSIYRRDGIYSAIIKQ